MMSRIDSWHWKIYTVRHFQNGHHNTAKIQHCPISSKFDMWVDNDVPNWFPTLKNFYRSPFSKWPPQYRTNSTLSDFNEISYLGRLWSELIPDIENFYRSPFLKWPPQYRTNSTLFDFNEISYVGRLSCPEWIPDIAKFLPVSIFKMVTTIPQKIKLRICHNAKCSFKLLSVAGLGDFIIVRL
jgi:hypothetical protein